LYEVIDQAGQLTMTETVTEAFTFERVGTNTFILGELGSYDPVSGFNFGSVTWNERGSVNFHFQDTLTDARSGTQSLSRTQSYANNLHTLNSSDQESFQFADLSTIAYDERGTVAPYTQYEGGSFAGCFALGSVAYDGAGSGIYAATRTANQSQT